MCDTNHFGLHFMYERVKALSGKMKILSDSSGTRIRIKIPNPTYCTEPK